VISWLRRYGGIVDERLVISDGALGRGLFAKEMRVISDWLIHKIYNPLQYHLIDMYYKHYRHSISFNYRYHLIDTTFKKMIDIYSMQSIPGNSFTAGQSCQAQRVENVMSYWLHLKTTARNPWLYPHAISPYVFICAMVNTHG
jgi:hypothetical protein